MFDSVCPVSSHAVVAKLCVILVIQNSLEPQKFDSKISFRRFIEEYSHEFSDVSFMYVYRDYQPGFVLPLKGNFFLSKRKYPAIKAIL